MKQQKRFLLSIIIDGTATIITMLLGFLVVPIYLSHISTEAFGLWSTVMEFFLFVSLLMVCTEFFIVRGMNEDKLNPGRASRNISLSILILGFWYLIFLLIAAFLFLTRENLATSLMIDEQFELYAFMMFWLGLQAMNYFTISILYGLHRTDLTGLFINLNKIGLQLTPILFLGLGYGLVSFGMGYASATILTFLLQLIFTARYLKGKIHLPKEGYKEAFSFTFQSVTSRMSFNIYNYLNVMIIAKYLGGIQVALYVLTMKLTNFGKFFAPRIVNMAYPSLNRLLVEEEYERLHEVSLKLFRFCLRLGILLAGLIFFLNEIFVTYWVGADKFGGFWLSLAAALIAFRESTVPLFYYTVFTTDEIKRTNQLILIEVILNIGLALWWVELWGVAGVGMATVVSTSFLSFFYMIYKTLGITKLKLASLLQSASFVLLKSLPALIALWYVREWLLGDFSWIRFLLGLGFVGMINLLGFEALILPKIKSLKPKDIMRTIIEHS